MLRLMGVYFIVDLPKIVYNSRKYRAKEIANFLENKRCVADLLDGLIYSELRSSSSHESLKSILANLIALQYGR